MLVRRSRSSATISSRPTGQEDNVKELDRKCKGRTTFEKEVKNCLKKDGLHAALTSLKTEIESMERDAKAIKKDGSPLQRNFAIKANTDITALKDLFKKMIEGAIEFDPSSITFDQNDSERMATKKITKVDKIVTDLDDLKKYLSEPGKEKEFAEHIFGSSMSGKFTQLKASLEKKDQYVAAQSDNLSYNHSKEIDSLVNKNYG